MCCCYVCCCMCFIGATIIIARRAPSGRQRSPRSCRRPGGGQGRHIIISIIMMIVRYIYIYIYVFIYLFVYRERDIESVYSDSMITEWYRLSSRYLWGTMCLVFKTVDPSMGTGAPYAQLSY